MPTIQSLIERLSANTCYITVNLQETVVILAALRELQEIKNTQI